MNDTLGSVHAKNAAVLGIVLLGSIPYGPTAVMSAGLGGAIQMVNLKLLERNVSWMLGLAGRGQAGAAQALVAVRLLGSLGLVGAVLLSVPVSPLAFALGLSTVVPAVLWHGVATARREA